MLGWRGRGSPERPCYSIVRSVSGAPASEVLVPVMRSRSVRSVRPACLWGLISLTGSASLPYVLQTLAGTVRPYSSLSLYPECSIFVLFWTGFAWLCFLCHSQNPWSWVVMGGEF